MGIPFDLSVTLVNKQAWIAPLVNNPDVVYTIPTTTGPYRIKAKWLLLNVLLWYPLIRRNLPIDIKRHGIVDTVLSKGRIAEVLTEIIDDVLALEPDAIDEVQSEAIGALMRATNMGIAELGAYHRSISTCGINQTLNIPEVAEAINIDITHEMTQGIHAVERKYAASYEKIIKVLNDPKLEGNVFRAFLIAGSLSSAQLPKYIGAGGTRTDVDDTMINLPIQSSCIDGFSDICEFMLDSRDAMKSIHYNHREMPFTQYTNRKQQLLASTIRYVYPGDCGTDKYIEFYIEGRFKKHVLGKNILVGPENRLVTLTRHNIDQYVDKIVKMRSVFTCNYTDGYCRTCGGKLSNNFPRNHFVPGIASAIEVMSPIAQLVLSNKHVSKTFAATYHVPYELNDIFMSIYNDIYLRPSVNAKDLWLGVPRRDIEKLVDLQHVKGHTIDAKYFSSINRVAVGKSGGEYLMTPEVDIKDQYGNKPYLTSELLRIIKNNPDMIRVDDTSVWIDLTDWDRMKPIMQCVIVNDSTRRFVQRIEAMFAQRIADYTSVNDAIRDFSNMIWERASPNILHLETVLRASLITDAVNYSIPVVTDPDNVKFAKLSQIIPSRTISTQLAFQELKKCISDPRAFIIPKETAVFDPYIGFNDTMTPFAHYVNS